MTTTATAPNWASLQQAALDVAGRFQDSLRDHGFTGKADALTSLKLTGTCDCGMGPVGDGSDTWFIDDECPHPGKCVMERLARGR
ncbi:hypothetical protein ABT255_42320 [Streptomyces mirabilis]|uniref:hypothetical protein n=1 Tax=Streptomyces mirabilis TaxID=68239 RepID=UPI0033250471